jgi:hypothetical protein
VVLAPFYVDQECSKIDKFINISNQVIIDTDCHIGVGYTSNVDWLIDARDFFSIYNGTDISKLNPRNHEVIDSHTKFIETFLFFFKDGRASERIAMNATVIKEISKFVS